MVSLSTAGILFAVLLVNYGQEIAAGPAGDPKAGAGLCTGFDGVCDPMNPDCCSGLYCHREKPEWKDGRCYYALQEVAPVESTEATEFCLARGLPCTGDDGDPADCCPGLYCHKPNPKCAEGRCYTVN